MTKIKVTRTCSNAVLPVKALGSSRGHDVVALHYTNLGAGKGGLLKTGLVMEARSDRIAFVFGRLPTEKYGKIEVIESFIETGNEIIVPVRNHNPLEADIDPYTTLSKVVLLKQSGGAPNIVDTLETTERGENGYGSTGMI